MPRRTLRIYFRTGSERRSFYWLSIGTDKSIYFSSSDSKNYRRGFAGQTEIPIGGARVNPAVDGRPMSKDEIDSYHSLHASGVFNLPTRSDGRRERRITQHLSTALGSVPLAALMPMEIGRYPLTKRTLTQLDIVIDCSNLLSQPFAMMLYAKRPEVQTPKAVERHQDWDIYNQYCSTVDSIDICAIVYANVKTFRRWPDLEVTFTSQPPEAGGEMPWTIFSEH